ncbi:MAG: hypothetical protein ACI9GW_003074 [Halieaceae bacterium]|jgi:hypothetical protein
MSDNMEFAKGKVSLNMPSGNMFLYQHPELLTRENHAHLGMITPDKPFEFARSAKYVPLVAAEMYSAQKHYPVVFSGKDNPVPMAILSVQDSDNIFLDEHGNWSPGSYIPSYLRRHPFAMAAGNDDKFAIVIDRASSAISDSPEHAFFDGDQLSPKTQAMVDFCGQYEAERRRTDAFAMKLKDLDLLAMQEISRQSDDGAKPLATYYAVDKEKLDALAPDQLCELHQLGYLSFIYAHLFSLENWNTLLERHQVIQQPE